jgi:S-adenosylmethionine:tRNA ribosyltransferase-isomerase
MCAIREFGGVNLSDFDYNLPHERIAQFPTRNREESRLLVYRKKNQKIEHKHFYQIIDILKAEDRVIINNSKVIPARIWCRKSTTGAAVEFLWIGDEKPGFWRGLLRGRHILGTRFESFKNFPRNRFNALFAKIR